LTKLGDYPTPPVRGSFFIARKKQLSVVPGVGQNPEEDASFTYILVCFLV
jgi:hypothetical protein